jgi:hypothetical protein
VKFNPHRRAFGVERPDLTGQIVGLCVVEQLAPAITSSQRWRIRCNAMTPERDQCGEVFYLSTHEVREYQQAGHELYCCKACRTRRRAARNLVRFSCKGCRTHVEMSRAKYLRRSELVRRFCGHCASCAARTHAHGTRVTQAAERARRSA